MGQSLTNFSGSEPKQGGVIALLQSERFAWIAIAAIFIFAMVLRALSYTNHDISWLLYLTAQYHEGATLYVDVSEVNPPLIFWMISPSVWFSELTGLSITGVFKAYVFLMAAGALALCAAWMRRLKFPAWPLMLTICAYVMTVLPGSDFGQREHLMVILSLPYLWLILARRNSIYVPMKLAVITAMTAAFGFYIKPHFVLVPAALEIYLLFAIGFRKTLVRPEQFILAGMAILYVAMVWIFTPEYVSRMLSYASEVYDAGYRKPMDIVVFRMYLPYLIALSGILWMLIRQQKTTHNAFPIFLIATICMGFVYVIQAKGFAYHAFPSKSFALLTFVILLMTSWRPADDDTLMKSGTTALLIIGLLATAIWPAYKFKYSDNAIRNWQSVLTAHPQTDTIFIMSANVYNGFPLVTDMNLTWASRFPCLWMVPGVQIRREELGHSTPLLDEIERFNHEAVAEDMQRYKPQIVLVDVHDKKSHFHGLSYNYLEDFSQNGAFRDVWKNYSKVDVVAGYEVYKLNSEAVSTANLR